MPAGGQGSGKGFPARKMTATALAPSLWSVLARRGHCIVACGNISAPEKGYAALYRTSRATAMFSAISSVWPLLLGVALFMMGSGLQGSLLGVRAGTEDFSALVTGVVMSAYFAGFLIGSMIVPRLVARVGHIRVFGALASLASIAVLLHAVFLDPVAWIALRLLTGFCYFGLFVVAESWLNERSTNATRGQLLSVYVIVMTGCMALGPLLLNIGNPDGFDLFIAASVMVSLALVPLSLTAYPAPAFHELEKLKLTQLYRISPLGVVGCVTNGATSGALIWLASVYAQKVGMPIASVSLFAFASIVGGMVLQWPLGQLSDIFDRRRVITGTTLAGAALAALAALYGGDNPVVLMLGVGVVGGMAIPLYTLSVAHTNDHLEPRQMVAASSGLLFANGLGGIAGPALAGGAMSILGPSGYFWFPAAAMAALGVFALWRMTQRAATPNEEQTPYVPVPRTSSSGAALALRNQMDRDIAGMARRR